MIIFRIQSNHDRSNSANHLEIARSLSTRLESVKDQHRRDIESLIRQRDDISRELTELRTTRNGYTEEISNLNQQRSLLIEQNADATRQLGMTKDSISKLRAPSPPSGRAHQYSPSGSSFVTSTSNLLLPRSPLSSSAKTGAPSPTIPDSDVELVHRDIKLDEQPAVVKKFKWGKGKVDTSRPAGTTVQSSAAARIAAIAPTRSSGSTDLSSRTHIFQQTSILRPVKCDYCGDKLWGLNEVRCTSKSSTSKGFFQN